MKTGCRFVVCRLHHVTGAHLIFAFVLLLSPLHVQHQGPGPTSELQGNALVHSLHHLTAQSKIRAQSISNLQPLCLKCIELSGGDEDTECFNALYV